MVAWRVASTVGCALFFGAEGCAEAAPDTNLATPPSTLVRDSAGVRIVENSDSVWTQAKAWRNASRDGSLWIRHAARLRDLLADPSRLSTNDWTVFDSDRRWLGTVTTPPELEIRAIGDDYVLGVRRDSLDVPFVQLHRLRKPEPAGS